jgi:hypothetical protein
MEEFKYKVYIKIDDNNCITEIESDLTLKDTTQWLQIDEGTGDKYAHAQGNYFTIDGNKPLMDEKFRYNYKLVDGKPAELTNNEKEILFPTPVSQKTQLEILQETIDTLVLSSLEV